MRASSPATPIAIPIGLLRFWSQNKLPPTFPKKHRCNLDPNTITGEPHGTVGYKLQLNSCMTGPPPKDYPLSYIFDPHLVIFMHREACMAAGAHVNDFMGLSVEILLCTVFWCLAIWHALHCVFCTNVPCFDFTLEIFMSQKWLEDKYFILKFMHFRNTSICLQIFFLKTLKYHFWIIQNIVVHGARTPIQLNLCMPLYIHGERYRPRITRIKFYFIRIKFLFPFQPFDQRQHR
jgi:hypothetical protein